MNTIRVLIVEADREPEIQNISNEQGIVELLGNEINYIELETNIDLIYNDVAKINNLEMNRVIKDDVICGSFIIAGNKNDEWISLSDLEIEKYKKLFRLKEDKELIQLLRTIIKESSNLLELNLNNIGQWRGVIK